MYKFIMTSLILSITALCCSFCNCKVVDMATTSVDNPSNPSLNESFMYFAYGSNLLSKRILIQNPTAKRRTAGKLKNYRLDFNTPSRDWNGCSATIVEDEGNDVWGAIWEIHTSNMADLDRQEGVERNLYKPLWKNIETSTGENVICRTYEKVIGPEETFQFEELPFDRQPSRTYLNCILNGAKESQLPIEYINNLKRIPHNNREANDPTLKQLF